MNRRRLLTSLAALPAVAVLPAVAANESVVAERHIGNFQFKPVDVEFAPTEVRAPTRLSSDDGDPAYSDYWIRRVKRVLLDGKPHDEAIMTADEERGFLLCYGNSGGYAPGPEYTVFATAEHIDGVHEAADVMVIRRGKVKIEYEELAA